MAALALALASLLNAQGLRKTAEIQPQGVRRDVAIAVTSRLAWLSHALYLDWPRHELKVALGRAGDDRIDTTVSLPPVQAARAHRPAVPRHVPARRARVRRPVVARPAFSRSKPLRVWVAGDSLVAAVGQALERATGSRGPVQVLAVESRISTGLGRPDVYNWYERFPQALASYHPRVAVLSFGADDAHNFMTGLPAGTTVGPLGSSSWDAEYERRLAGVAREFNDAGTYVVWLGLPVIRGTTWNETFKTMNRLLEAAAAAHPQTSTYIDSYRLLATRSGGYSDYLRGSNSQLVLMRAPDGVHYEPPAGDLIANAILTRLGTVFDLRSGRVSRTSAPAQRTSARTSRPSTPSLSSRAGHRVSVGRTGASAELTGAGARTLREGSQVSR